MKLTNIDLKGYGRFCDEPATFRIERYHLPEPWDYVYTNGDMLLRVKHNGCGYLQSAPPGGPALFRPERSETAPMMLAWIVPEDAKGKPGGAFTNFWMPTVSGARPDAECEQYSCTFSPEAARYVVRHEDWVVETTLFVPPDAPALVMNVSVKNASRRKRACTLIPAVRPHLAPFSLAPWDKPEMYQTAAFQLAGGVPSVWMETRNPSGDASKRLRAAVVTDLAATRFEVSLDEMTGAGGWTGPEAAWTGTLARSVRAMKSVKYGDVTDANAALGRHICAAFSRKVTLKPGAHVAFTMVFGRLPDTADGSLPPKRELTVLARYLKPAARERALARNRKRYESLFAIRRIETPDEAMSRYVNEWLPLQLEWVSLLDRGWPTGMRGTRDAAQDATGIIPLAPEVARERVVEIVSCQRTDGWFVRQYSTAGPDGKHDLRPYVDSAIWVWELLRDYLYVTRDFKILAKKLRWLDTTRAASVLEHVVRLFEWYLARTNIGEHGLVKIGEGDWNDSVNGAGLEGRGETVMVTCQVVMGLTEAADLLAHLDANKHASAIRRFRAGAKRFRSALLEHARNRDGYFNAVFNDAGHWIFSPADPDGRARVNGPANSFAVIAGIVDGKAREHVIDCLNRLKGPHGWRLFHPAIGEPPIAKLGRIGQGDMKPGLAENGTCYNHGAHGFLGRAAWVAGKGAMLHEIFRYMFGYDQKAHPVDVAKIAPYAVPNHWREAVGQDGVGGDTFLSGSISTALRNIYQGVMGFRPGLTDLVIDPCIPPGWEGLTATTRFLDATWEIRIWNPDGRENGVKRVMLDGREVGALKADDRLGREVWSIPIDALARGGRHILEVRM